MKQRMILIILMLITAINGYSQRNISVPNYTYTPRSYEEIKAEADIFVQQFHRAQSELNSLTDIVVTALAQSIDEIARQELNSDYNNLKDLSYQLKRSGLSEDVKVGINRVRQSINDHIVSYNNRIAEYQREYEEEQRRIAAEEAKRAAEPEEWSGTGIALKNGFIVTNYHVIENAKTIIVQGVNGFIDKQYDVDVVATDIQNDLALLKIVDSGFTGFGTIPYSVKTTTSEVGEDIFVLGYPLTSTMGEEIKLTTGVISSKTGFQGDVSMYQISAPVQPGNSGGPLFDNKGNLIGIINAKHNEAENVGYAIKTLYLQNLVESSLNNSVLPKNNMISNQSLTGKVKAVKDFVFLIRCERESTNDSQNQNYLISND